MEESKASSRIPGNLGSFETGSAVPLQAATGTSDQGNAKSAPDKATHLAVCLSPFLGDEGCCPFDGSITLGPHEAVNQKDKRGEWHESSCTFYDFKTNIRFIFGKLEVSNVNEKLGLVFRESANFGLCKWTRN